MAPNLRVGQATADSDFDFEALVSSYYVALYRFAYSLTRSEADASDLTQQTFWVWASKGHQLRDKSKVKSWLFTTLRREFLKLRRHMVQFPQVELSEVESELPAQGPDVADVLEVGGVLKALAEVDQVYQVPLALFYVDDMSYQEIAEILGVPIGTVQSRLYRGKAQLQRLLAKPATVSAEGSL